MPIGRWEYLLDVIFFIKRRGNRIIMLGSFFVGLWRYIQKKIKCIYGYFEASVLKRCILFFNGILKIHLYLSLVLVLDCQNAFMCSVICRNEVDQDKEVVICGNHLA
ncbi:hypothetical protein BDA99DRAFT_539185 [Phascolomyces articulosus]|uniref:Uncharacterized protein n=1 Tax=Phascolomyces articulosus TaxID=60185 RepID=A0AAD5PC94_9FUNG|nr:hypothetical protein BDA99DRAFT_539185 [Phascolomyces articulosus]